MSLSEAAIEISAGDLAQIVEAVFETMMNLQAFRCDKPWFPSDERVTAAVQLSGSWNGSLTVECDAIQACRLAGRFLSIEAPGSIDDVARDVIGELANMVGGNLKSVLAPDITISMPLVLDGSTSGLPASCTRMTFESAEGMFWVNVMKEAP